MVLQARVCPGRKTGHTQKRASRGGTPPDMAGSSVHRKTRFFFQPGLSPGSSGSRHPVGQATIAHRTITFTRKPRKVHIPQECAAVKIGEGDGRMQIEGLPALRIGGVCGLWPAGGGVTGVKVSDSSRGRAPLCPYSGACGRASTGVDASVRAAGRPGSRRHCLRLPGAISNRPHAPFPRRSKVDDPGPEA